MSKEIKYKDTGIPYCPQIPENWDVKRLKFVGKSIIGITYNPTQVTDEENGKLVLRSSNVQNGVLSFEDNVYVNSEINEKHLTKEGDILICARNGSAHLVGKCAYIPKEYEGLTFGAFMLMFRSEFGKFMYYVFNSNLFKSQTGLYKTSTINQLTSDTINNLFVALPNNIQEQEKIAQFLDLKMTEIDNIISKKQNLIDTLKEEKLAVITKAVTKGIDPEVKLQSSFIEWYPKIPQHWIIIKLKWISKIYSGGTPDKNKSEYWLDGNIPWLNSGSVNQFYITEPSEFITEEGLKNSSAKWIEENSIVIALAGQGKTKGMVGLVTFKVTCNQSMGVIFPDVSILNNKFLLYFLHINYYNLRGLSGEGIRDGLNLEMIGNVKITLPGVDEQKTIVSFVEEEMIKIDNTVKTIEQEIELIKEYKASLINEVVTGKIQLN